MVSCNTIDSHMVELNYLSPEELIDDDVAPHHTHPPRSSPLTTRFGPRRPGCSVPPAAIPHGRLPRRPASALAAQWSHAAPWFPVGRVRIVIYSPSTAAKPPSSGRREQSRHDAREGKTEIFETRQYLESPVQVSGSCGCIPSNRVSSPASPPYRPAFRGWSVHPG